VRYGRIGRQRERVRGEYWGRYLRSKKKRENLLRNLHRRRKNFFFIYDVLVKQNLKKRPANHYSPSALPLALATHYSSQRITFTFRPGLNGIIK
jgi:hypothetical protein